MNRQDLYDIYQKNIELLENELGQVKKLTQINLGKLYYTCSNKNKLGQIKKNEKDVLGNTRLYTFLLCSWLEVRLKKILYEGSSAAFSDDERKLVLQSRNMSEKWRCCLNISVCKSYGIIFEMEKYNNIQKLDLLYKVFRLIAEIISSYVVYKDKVLTNNFNREIEDKICKIENYQKRIEKSDFYKYCIKFAEQEKRERECKKEAYV